MATSAVESNVTIRKAEKKDMVFVFKMIKDLADYESMTYKLKINGENLTQDFCENAFKSIVVETSDGSLIGYAIYTVDYSTWDGKSLLLQDIYIQPKYRKQNIGEKLFVAVIKDGDSLGCKRAHFHVLSWNPAIEFYKRLGCTDGGDYQVYRLEQENFRKLIEQYK